MKMWNKVLLCVALSIMCLFTCVGYAAISGSIDIIGEAEIVPPDAMYIYEIRNVVTSNATLNMSPVYINHPSTKFMSEIKFGGRNAYVSFDVIVMNGTKIDQFFDIIEEFAELEEVEGSFSYANVSASVNPGQGAEVKAGQSLQFTVTLKYTGSNSNQTRRMLHELKFVLDSKDLTQAVSRGITDQFADIINGNLEEDITYEYDGKTITIPKDGGYDAIMDHMETFSLSGSYIGNLSGSDDDDKAVLTALFEGALTFKVGNEEVPVTVMIKEKDVYGSNTKELVLYITADTLSESRAYVPIYAVVFTKSNDEWIQVGDILQGEAQVTAYDGLGATLGYGTGSFNTEKWRSTAGYYGVATGKDLNAVMSGYENQNK